MWYTAKQVGILQHKPDEAFFGIVADPIQFPVFFLQEQVGNEQSTQRFHPGIAAVKAFELFLGQGEQDGGFDGFYGIGRWLARKERNGRADKLSFPGQLGDDLLGAFIEKFAQQAFINKMEVFLGLTGLY